MNADDPKEQKSQQTPAPTSASEETIIQSPALGNSSSPAAAARMAQSPAGATAPPVTPPPDSSITGEFAALVGPSLRPGSLLASRYEILQMLGQGGMGAVYKARDRHVDRLVAIKIIRPEMAANPAILQRFIQELVLARQITHRNVIRIYDIGEADGIKFITMEYVEGKDLRSIITERGKLPPEEAVGIVEQIAAGLSAAHAEGVIHRDLKPGNIMQDASGRIIVMDFGLARTVGGDGMTQTGMMLGTMEYMSPEQAKAEELDARSDLYTLGLIFFELLSGQMPFRADSALASLVMRTQQRAIPLVTVDANVPVALSNIVARCIERDPAQRYRGTEELIEDLRAWRGGAVVKSVLVHPTFPELTKTPVRRYIAMAVVAVALLIGGSVFVKMKYFPSGSAAQDRTGRAAVTLLVADFQNETNDAVFDGTIEPAFGLALEGASFINSYARGQARKIIGQIQPGTTALDERAARLVAQREGISVVISGKVAKKDAGYEISARAVDAVTGDVISTANIDTESKDKVLQGVASLAAKTRKALGDATPESTQMAAAETYTSSSLEAAHYYALAQEQRYAGKTEEAIRGFQKATELDPGFGTAYAGLAALSANLGRREDAKKAYQMAMQHLDRMTDREKYRTRGGYYLATLDAPHAIEEFTALTKEYPADNMGHAALAFAYYLRRDMAKAKEEGKRALEIYPKNVPYRNNFALYSLYSGDFNTAETEAETALAGNPAYLKAYLTLALAQIAQGKHDQAAQTYGKLQQVSAAGASFAASGLADLAMYEGRNKDAIEILTSSIAADIAANKKDSAAKKMVMLAEAQYSDGNKAAAQASVDKALVTSKADVLFSAARMLVDLGQFPKASTLAGELGAQVEPVPEAQAKLIEAEISLKKGKHAEAVQLLQSSIAISDLWLARFALGRAYLASDAYPQADGEFDRCVKRQGESSDAFLDEMPTFHYYPAAIYQYGVLRAAQNNTDGANAFFKTFLAMRNHATNDPLVDDAKKRIK